MLFVNISLLSFNSTEELWSLLISFVIISLFSSDSIKELLSNIVSEAISSPIELISAELSVFISVFIYMLPSLSKVVSDSFSSIK